VNVLTPRANPAPLQDKVAIVTGASRGIGRAIALTLAAHHATVCLVGRCRETLQQVAQTANSGSMHVIEAELTDDEALRTLARFVEREFQRADILVHSAGLYGRGPLAETSIDQFDLLYRSNVRAPYLLTQLLLPLLVANTGQVVFVNSSQGLSATPNVGQFGATQHALKAIADSLRAEINQDSVRVLSVFPGRTATPRIEDLYLSDQKTYQPELLLQPVDIASVVVNALALPRTAEVTNISIRPFVKSY